MMTLKTKEKDEKACWAERKSEFEVKDVRIK